MSSWHTRVLISAPGGSSLLTLLFSSLRPFGSAFWVGPEPFSVCPELSAGPLVWAPLALICAVLVVLGASLRHLAGHLGADHWRQSLGSTVTGHSDHRRKEQEPLEGQEALLRREELQKETVSEGSERRREKESAAWFEGFLSRG